MKRFLLLSSVAVLYLVSCTKKSSNQNILTAQNLKSAFIYLSADSAYNLKTAKGAILKIDENSFDGTLLQKQIIFSGSGHAKFQKIINQPNALFSTAAQHAGHLAELAGRSFLQKKFADIAYCEPFYLKEFFTKQQPL